jgi:prevent-host-death family protein
MSATIVAMTDVASRELRNQTRALLERVEAGEDIRITVDGRPVAILVRAPSRPRAISRDRFVALFADAQADPGLRAQLAELNPDTTDDLG